MSSRPAPLPVINGSHHAQQSNIAPKKNQKSSPPDSVNYFSRVSIHRTPHIHTSHQRRINFRTILLQRPSRTSITILVTLHHPSHVKLLALRHLPTLHPRREKMSNILHPLPTLLQQRLKRLNLQLNLSRQKRKLRKLAKFYSLVKRSLLNTFCLHTLTKNTLFPSSCFSCES